MGRLLFSVLSLLFFVSVSNATTLNVGPREDILSSDTIKSKGLGYWPDAGIGVVNNGGGSYTFFSSSGGGLCSPDGKFGKTVGTLTNPVATSAKGCTQMYMKKGYNYNGGGDLFYKDASGTLYTIYHAELWPHGDYLRYWSVLGMAKSTDGGESWTDLGEIINPTTPYDPEGTKSLDVGFGSVVIVGQYFYLYFLDIDPTMGFRRASVARAKVTDVLSAAANNNVVPWFKYYNGAWTQPGIGGQASYFGTGTEGSGGAVVSFNSYLNKYIMVNSSWNSGTHNDLSYCESSDGLNWSPRQVLESDPGNSRYHMIVGLGSNPHDTNSQFYVYYQYIFDPSYPKTYSLARRLVTLNGVVSPTPTPTPTATPIPTPTPTPTSAPSGSIKINFQPSTAAVPSGYLADGGAVYGNRGNGYSYGWNADNSGNARDRDLSNSPDQRYDTFNHMQRNGTFSWKIAVANGSYQVRIVAGDAYAYDSVFKINAESTLAVNGAPTASNLWIDSTVTVNVSDGYLDITNASGATNNKVAFIEITPGTVTLFQKKINFQPSAAVVPSGYVADSGSVYGSRGNGLTYGWNLDNSADMRDREMNADQRYDTFAHMQKSGTFSWEIAVPNGTYSVHIIAGDAYAYDSVFKINVEGVLGINGTPTSAQRYIENTILVTVTDGKLSITNAAGSLNNKINFVDILQTQ